MLTPSQERCAQTEDRACPKTSSRRAALLGGGPGEGLPSPGKASGDFLFRKFLMTHTIRSVARYSRVHAVGGVQHVLFEGWYVRHREGTRPEYKYAHAAGRVPHAVEVHIPVRRSAICTLVVALDVDDRRGHLHDSRLECMLRLRGRRLHRRCTDVVS